jgi:predicted MFS family arabinose efflux permease
MAAVGLFFAGQFALFTYLRPFLETVTGVSVSALSLILLVVGLAGLAGTYLIGLLLRTSLYGLLISMPLVMAAVAIGLLALGGSAAAVTMLLVFWGLIGTAAPVAWWTWMSKVLPNDAEAGGGLMVAVIQLAITVGAALGGSLFDGVGYQATFAASAMLLCSSALLALIAARTASPLATHSSAAKRRLQLHRLNGEHSNVRPT